jgi:protein TonB
MKSRVLQLDFLDLIFLNKNKDYGAYFLRRNYPSYLTISLFVAVLLFISGSLGQFLYTKYLNREAPGKTIRNKEINLEIFPPPPIEREKKDIDYIIDSKISTIKYMQPIIKPDEIVNENILPTVEELINLEPGLINHIGNPNGIDPTLLEIEEPNIINNINQDEKQEVYEWVEEMPKFKGGEEELLKFIVSNIKYPEIAKRTGIEGKVFVSFVISKTGNIINAKIDKSIGGGCEEEALRIISNMPSWNPGKQNGVPVNVKVTIPIYFKLKS